MFTWGDAAKGWLQRDKKQLLELKFLEGNTNLCKMDLGSKQYFLLILQMSAQNKVFFVIYMQPSPEEKVAELNVSFLSIYDEK